MLKIGTLIVLFIHMTFNIQSECIISAKYSYAKICNICNIDPDAYLRPSFLPRFGRLTILGAGAGAGDAPPPLAPLAPPPLAPLAPPPRLVFSRSKTLAKACE